MLSAECWVLSMEFKLKLVLVQLDARSKLKLELHTRTQHSAPSTITFSGTRRFVFLGCLVCVLGLEG